MGHGAWGMGPRVLGLARCRSIGHYLLPITYYQFSIVPHLYEKGYITCRSPNMDCFAIGPWKIAMFKLYMI